ncbi:MAG: hypothetical protein ACYCV6_04925 [Steroidobacteraceae bacterium]
MRENNRDRNSWWMGAAVALPLLLCCALPLIVGAFGVAAITATVKYGIAGLLVVGLVGVGLYLLRAASRRHLSGSAPTDAVSHCGCDPTVTLPHLKEPPAQSPPKSS